MRLAGISLLAAGLAVALYVVGRVHRVNPASSLFGQQYGAAVALKAVLATVALGLAVLQVLLAVWMYRKLPLAVTRHVRCRWHTGLWVSGSSLLPCRSRCIA